MTKLNKRAVERVLKTKPALTKGWEIDNIDDSVVLSLDLGIYELKALDAMTKPMVARLKQQGWTTDVMNWGLGNSDELCEGCQIVVTD
jgi:hypothetical protein